MKLQTTFALFLCLLVSGASAQQFYKNKKMISATTERAAIQIAGNWYENAWRVSPKIANDTFSVKLYGKQEKVGFRTDKDSLFFIIKPGKAQSFYIKLGDAEPAHTIINPSAYVWDKVSYGNTAAAANLKFFFDNTNGSYYDSLQRIYPLAEEIKNDRTDTEKILSVLNWTHHQWKHDGGNAPKGNTGLAILNEAKAGGRFPCFAYAIVLRDQLTALGYKARVLYLKTKDAEVRKSSPGHVATEVYVNDLKKWVFIDGQFNVMPTLGGMPLNAIEFQHALSYEYEKVVLSSKDVVSKWAYTDFVYDYLYYLDTALDNRNMEKDQKYTIEGKRSMMLVPAGASNLKKISFWNSVVDYCIYTKSLKDFYPN